MQIILATVVRHLFTEYVFKRVIYIGLKSLAKSTKNTVDDELVKVVGQALELEEKE